MKMMYAPWRLEFILGKKEKGCVFCNRVKRRKNEEDYILYRGKWNFVILNKFPYNNGHLMVIPNRHIAHFEELKPEETSEMTALLQKATKILRRAFRPQGFNLGMNLGRAAGAGIKDHLHFHVVPRWEADTNFWPILAETKSLPQHLRKTYDGLKKFWR